LVREKPLDFILSTAASRKTSSIWTVRCPGALTDRFKPHEQCSSDDSFDFFPVRLLMRVFLRIREIAMAAGEQSQSITGNRLLALLPKGEYARLIPFLKPVNLKRKEVLYHAGDTIKYCYFPLSGIVSLLSPAAEGKAVEVGMVGNEGMIGVSAPLQIGITPYDLITQIETEALQIDARILKAEFNRGGTLHELLLRYIYALLCQISQSVVCHHFHTVEQRLARWLLMGRDRLQSNTFPLTQEFLAHLLGIPRTNVTMTARALQQAGLIDYKRGTITITEEKGLEDIACNCYRIIKKATDDILK